MMVAAATMVIPDIVVIRVFAVILVIAAIVAGTGTVERKSIRPGGC